MVWLRSNITAIEYRIAELEKQKMEMMKERKSFIAKRAEVLSINRVEQVAMGRLGLQFREDRSRVFHVKRDEGDLPYGVSFKSKQ